MDNLSHIPEIQEMVDKEAVDLVRKHSKLDLFKKAILIISGSEQSAEKDDILSEVESDIDRRYWIEEITMQERLELLSLIR